MIKIISKKTWSKLQPNLELASKLEEATKNHFLIEKKLNELQKLEKEREVGLWMYCS